MNKTTDPFRITIILGDESPVAQIEQIMRIIDDGGELITSKVLPAETLEMPLSEEIIGALNASLLAQVETLTAERDGLTTERDALTTQVETLTAERDGLTGQVASLTAERDAVTSERDGLLAQVESLTKAQEIIEPPAAEYDNPPAP